MKRVIKFYVLFTAINEFAGPFDTLREAAEFGKDDPRGGYNPWRAVQDYVEV